MSFSILRPPRALGAALAAGVLSFGLAACGGDDDREPLPAAVAPGPAEAVEEVESGASALVTASVPIADLLDNADGCVGATVRTTGTVVQVLGSREVVLAGDETRAEGGNGLNVLLAAELPDQAGQPDDPEISEGDTFTVTGVFQVLERLPTSADGDESDFRGVPTLVATNVEAGGGEVPQNGGTGEGSPCAAGLVEGVGADQRLATIFGDELVATGVGTGVPAADILENPGSCLDRRVTTSGEITRVLGPRTVVLAGDETRAEGASGIAVLLAIRIPDVAGAGQDPALEVGDQISVRGPLRALERADVRGESRQPDFRGLPYLVAYEIERGGTEVQQGGDTGEGGGCERFGEVRLAEFDVAEPRAVAAEGLEDEDGLEEEPLP